MKMKIIYKTGVKYYAGKNKYGEIKLVSNEKAAKEFSQRAKGALNQIGNKLLSMGAIDYEYID